MKKKPQELKNIARKVRAEILRLSHARGISHVGSALSGVDITVALYFNVMNIDPSRPLDPVRDRFILSKGHAALAQYVVLQQRGFFSREKLYTCGCEGAKLAEHPPPGCAAGIEAATGSLGHGPGLCIGMALAGRIGKRKFNNFTLVSDGEVNEGSIWEAALFAPVHELDNVAVIVDYNKWQATGRSNEVMRLEPLREKWETFGWRAEEIDGHDMIEIVDVLSSVPDGSGRPLAVVANTVKGKGVSFMEDDNNWHYRVPDDDELEAALEELGES